MSDGVPSRAPLVGGPAAQLLAGLERWVKSNDAYPYQRALSGHAGPWADVDGRRVLALSSYDYLGLIGHPAIEAAAIEAIRRYGTATGGVRLLTGTTVLHRELEAALAAFLGVPAVLTFSSGYLANLAAIAALFEPADEILVDALAHRSIIDGCLLARARVRRFRHNDLDMLERLLARGAGAGGGTTTAAGRRRLIVVEGVYSMDGDVPPLREIVALKQRHGAFLMVDDAHALGVIGDTGRGSLEHHGVPADAVDLLTGALSKAVPATGGFVAARPEVVRHLSHAAPPFVFSSAAAPSVAASARAALDVIAAEPERLTRLRAASDTLRDGLAARGWNVGLSSTAIVPVHVGGELPALGLARRLLDESVHATPIIHPAVPRGAERLRLCASAAHRPADLAHALDAFTRLRELAAPVGDDAA